CYLPGGKITRADLLNADALLTRTRTQCGAELLDGTAVKFIASATIGYDHIDTRYCESNGIYWTNAPGCNSESVAQYLTSLLLNLAHRRGQTLKGKTIGVIGVGNVGSKVARNASALGMKVLLNDPPRARREGSANFSELEEIKQEADFITFHVPLNREGEDATFHAADKTFFNSLRKKPFFINSSRGEVCDNAALKQTLREGGLQGAALDVWENEPVIDLELMNLLDFATPHIAGYSADGKSNGTAMSILSLVRFFGLEKRFNRSALQSPPLPQLREIDLRPYVQAGETETDLLYRAVTASYDIVSDDLHLREKPDEFEKLRGNYPLRREFDSFTITAPPVLDTILKTLRFKVREGA
ncbi:MAG: 4-phosphoerythronate dehydrogenase, partial [Lentisphaeria bacterium]|nr:4-phosphoerythronate dehydrogenase [Lentisphaeria bacterium]